MKNQKKTFLILNESMSEWPNVDTIKRKNKSNIDIQTVRQEWTMAWWVLSKSRNDDEW